jgi:hypothetical protein
MREIRISPTAQVIALGVLGAALVGAVAAQFPEIRRYLKIETM